MPVSPLDCDMANWSAKPEGPRHNCVRNAVDAVHQPLDWRLVMQP